MITLKFEGGKELAAALGSLSQRVSRRLQLESLEEAAVPLQKSMSRKAPRRAPKPDMADEILIMRTRGQDRQEAAVAVGPSKRAFYGPFQEFGTAHHAAQPFARPAFDETWQKSLSILSEALWRELAGRGVQRTATVSTPVQSDGRVL